MKELLALVSTVIVTEVATKIAGLKRFNEIKDWHIFTNERQMEIIVKYLDYHVDTAGNRFEIVDNHYKIIPNPNRLPTVAPEEDPTAELFDPSTDEYFLWVNGAMGEGIAESTITRLQSINGTA